MTAPTIWRPIPGTATGGGGGKPLVLNGSATAGGSGTATVIIAPSPPVDVLVDYVVCAALGSGATAPQVIVYDAVAQASGYFDSGALIKPGPATVGWYTPPRLLPASHSLICVFSGLNSGDLATVRVEYTWAD